MKSPCYYLQKDHFYCQVTSKKKNNKKTFIFVLCTLYLQIIYFPLSGYLSAVQASTEVHCVFKILFLGTFDKKKRQGA